MQPAGLLRAKSENMATMAFAGNAIWWLRCHAYPEPPEEAETSQMDLGGCNRPRSVQDYPCVHNNYEGANDAGSCCRGGTPDFLHDWCMLFVILSWDGVPSLAARA